MTKPVKIKTKKGRKLDGYFDETRRLLFTQYITAELATQCGWSWEEDKEQLREAPRTCASCQDFGKGCKSCEGDDEG